MNWDLTVILALANLPLYFLIGWAFFGDWGGFKDSIYYHIMPDWVSAARGELMDDWFAEYKIFIFILTCVSLIGAENALIGKFFPEWGEVDFAALWSMM